MDKKNILAGHLSELTSQITDGRSEDIKLALSSLSKEIKGTVFEHFLAELYRGNGWLTKVQGGRGD